MLHVSARLSTGLLKIVHILNRLTVRTFPADPVLPKQSKIEQFPKEEHRLLTE